MSGKLALHFSDQFEGVIWDLHYLDDWLVVSVREEENFQTSFSLLNTKTSTYAWENVVFEEEWWIGVSSIHDEVIVFHTYDDAQNPEAKSLFGLDRQSLEVRWQVENLKPVGTDQKWLYGRMTADEMQQFYRLKVDSGELEEIESAGWYKNATAAASEGIIAPLCYTDDQSYFTTVKTFLSRKFGMEVIKQCEYLEWAGMILASVFIQNEQSLENRLLVMDEGGELLMNELLHSKISGLITDTFFLAGEQLIFVKDRSQIFSYKISS